MDCDLLFFLKFTGWLYNFKCFFVIAANIWVMCICLFNVHTLWIVGKSGFLTEKSRLPASALISTLNISSENNCSKTETLCSIVAFPLFLLF